MPAWVALATKLPVVLLNTTTAPAFKVKFASTVTPLTVPANSSMSSTKPGSCAAGTLPELSSEATPPGNPFLSPPMADCTKAVVAICVVLVPAVAVGALGVPVSVGLAVGALASRAAWRPSTLPITWLWLSSLTLTTPPVIVTSPPLFTPPSVEPLAAGSVYLAALMASRLALSTNALIFPQRCFTPSLSRYFPITNKLKVKN